MAECGLSKRQAVEPPNPWLVWAPLAQLKPVGKTLLGNNLPAMREFTVVKQTHENGTQWRLRTSRDPA